MVVVPVTLAVNGNVPPVTDEAVAGDTPTPVTVGLGDGLFVGAAVTVIVAIPTLVGSATLVAVTTDVPADSGAVYTPAADTLPVDACHVTARFVVVPLTTGVSDSVAPLATVAVAGETETAVTPEPVGGLLGALTVTTADADLVGSATLMAVTVPVPADAGAV